MNPELACQPAGQRGKSPALAALSSVILPGLGQIYCGQDNKGVFLLGMSLLGYWSTGGLSSLFLCPAIAADALMIARRLNLSATVGRWEFFPAIKLLNAIPPRVILAAIVLAIATLTVLHIVQFASN
jgi:hypothetical protein